MKNKSLFQTLVDKLQAAGCEASFKDDGAWTEIRVDGEVFRVDVREERSSGRLRRPNGKMRIYVGSWGTDRMSFPQNKSGSFNFDLIVKRIKLEVQGRKRREEVSKRRESKMAKTQREIEQLRRQHGLTPDRDGSVGLRVTDTGIEFSLSTAVTRSQASALVEAAKRVNLAGRGPEDASALDYGKRMKLFVTGLTEMSSNLGIEICSHDGLRMKDASTEGKISWSFDEMGLLEASRAADPDADYHGQDVE